MPGRIPVAIGSCPHGARNKSSSPYFKKQFAFRDAISGKTARPPRQIRDPDAKTFNDKAISSRANTGAGFSLHLTFINLAFVMSKRGFEECELNFERPAKRRRESSIDRFSRLSDELNLRILSHLTVSDLTICQRYVVSLSDDFRIYEALLNYQTFAQV